MCALPRHISELSFGFDYFRSVSRRLLVVSMSDEYPVTNQAEATDASAVNDGVTIAAAEVDNSGDTITTVNFNGASITYSPEDLESQRASPIEVDIYLSQEENWCAVKQEMGLEERTASLSLHESNAGLPLQSLPSTSQGFFTPHYTPRKYSSILPFFLPE